LAPAHHPCAVRVRSNRPACSENGPPPPHAVLLGSLQAGLRTREWASQPQEQRLPMDRSTVASAALVDSPTVAGAVPGLSLGGRTGFPFLADDGQPRVACREMPEHIPRSGTSQYDSIKQGKTILHPRWRPAASGARKDGTGVTPWRVPAPCPTPPVPRPATISGDH